MFKERISTSISTETENLTDLPLPKGEKPSLREKYLIRNFDEKSAKFISAVRKGFILNGKNSLAIIEEKREDSVRYMIEEIQNGISKRIFNEIDEASFNILWDRSASLKLEKTEYEKIYETETLGEIPSVVSRYHGELEGLNIAELTFPSVNHDFDFKPAINGLTRIENKKSFEESEMALSGVPREFFRNETVYAENVPRYTVLDGIRVLWLKICSMKTDKSPAVIAITGGSNSGKTQVVAKTIEETGYKNIVKISLDNYYRGKKWMDEQAEKGIVLNWDQPEALNLDLLKKHLQMLKNGETVEIPVYDFKTHEPDPEKTIIIDPKNFVSNINLTPTQKAKREKYLQAILIEGLFSLNEILRDEADFKVFVSSDSATRLMRRVFRDVVERGRSPESVISTFAEVVNPMHEKYIEPTSEFADMIIENPLVPAVESQNSGLHEVQLKFQVDDIDEEYLVSRGAKYLETLHQKDVYYDPVDRNFIETKEMLRIRTQKSGEEGSEQRFFTYKGPKMNLEGFPTRPIYECRIDPETEEEFTKQYGVPTKTIIKNRKLFELDGIIFSLDIVEKQVRDNIITLGKFIEIRSIENIPSKCQNGNTATEDHITICEKVVLKNIAQKLGFEDKDISDESYYEM